MAELEVDDHVERPARWRIAVPGQDVEDNLVAGGAGTVRISVCGRA